MARRVFMTEVSGGRVRGRLRLGGWMVGVKVAMGNRGMTVDAAEQFFFSSTVVAVQRPSLRLHARKA